MELTNKQKLSLRNIAELIEDKQYPAKRVIADYAIQLLPFEVNEEATKYMESLFKKIEEEL